ncbi:MAG: dephospho-CoA kinase [Thermotogaceae bacterium]|nr:dephospho-CoA kinase [Thermotogaceae bacterium]MDN5337153.1 dephospho-CoA kinase [Thermotogaceae bacterium]
MLLVALTGGAGTGKTTVAEFLRKSGITVIDLDKVGHETLELENVKKKLVEVFGREILKDDRIDRKKLRNIAFDSKENLKKLNEIVHPEMINMLWRKIRELNDENIVVVEGAIIPELGLTKDFDFIVITDVPKEVQIKRVAERNKIPFHLAERIVNYQMDRKKRLELADYVIDTSGDINKTLEQAKKLLKLLKSMV